MLNPGHRLQRGGTRPRRASPRPPLVLDWRRFCSDTIVQYVRMQANLLRELTPNCPVTTNLKPLLFRFDHFDLAEVLDFVATESAAVNTDNITVNPGVTVTATSGRPRWGFMPRAPQARPLRPTTGQSR